MRFIQQSVFGLRCAMGGGGMFSHCLGCIQMAEISASQGLFPVSLSLSLSLSAAVALCPSPSSLQSTLCCPAVSSLFMGLCLPS